jgi:hypothetical protein
MTTSGQFRSFVVSAQLTTEGVVTSIEMWTKSSRLNKSQNIAARCCTYASVYVGCWRKSTCNSLAPRLNCSKSEPETCGAGGDELRSHSVEPGICAAPVGVVELRVSAGDAGRGHGEHDGADAEHGRGVVLAGCPAAALPNGRSLALAYPHVKSNVTR